VVRHPVGRAARLGVRRRLGGHRSGDGSAAPGTGTRVRLAARSAPLRVDHDARVLRRPPRDDLGRLLRGVRPEGAAGSGGLDLAARSGGVGRGRVLARRAHRGELAAPAADPPARLAHDPPELVPRAHHGIGARLAGRIRRREPGRARHRRPVGPGRRGTVRRPADPAPAGPGTRRSGRAHRASAGAPGGGRGCAHGPTRARPCARPTRALPLCSTHPSPPLCSTHRARFRRRPTGPVVWPHTRPRAGWTRTGARGTTPAHPSRSRDPRGR
jgi:hypothetical protein